MSKEASCSAVEGLLGYVFKNRDRLWLALQAAGSGIGGPDAQKRLAMIGDAILKVVILLDLEGTGAPRGAMDRRVQMIVSNDNLVETCDASGITRHIKGNPSQVNLISPKTKAAAIEAILAAVFLDSANDIGALRKVMAQLGLGALDNSSG